MDLAALLRTPNAMEWVDGALDSTTASVTGAAPPFNNAAR